MKIVQKILLICFLQLLLLISKIGYTQQAGNDYIDDTNFPKGKMGIVLQKFINTVNQNDSNLIKEFIKNNLTLDFQNEFPIKDHKDYFYNIYQQTGGIIFYSIRNYSPDRPEKTVVIFKDKKFDLWIAFSFTFESKIDYLIKAFNFLDARPPTNLNESKILESELSEKANEIMTRLCNNDFFSGTILIAKGIKVLYQNACGEASKSYHVENKIDTKFNIGSMNKMFTSVAIMKLVENNKLKVNDTISKFVDESWLPKKISNKITIHHLLSHTSGLGSYFNDTFWNSSRELYRKVDDYKPLVKDDTLAFEPGVRYSYSNIGMLLLGVVIQNVTGVDYFDYIHQNIYKPASMINSDEFEMDQPVENIAIGYVPTLRNKYGWDNNLFKHVIKGGPAGGGFSTVGDLHHFALALLNEQLVSKSSLDLLWTDHSKSGYGYGFQLKMGPKGKVVGHGGDFPGISSKFDIFLDNGFIVVVLSNYSDVAIQVERLMNQLICRLKV